MMKRYPKVALLKARAHHRGGLEKYTQRLAQAFIRRGCEVTLLTTGSAPPIAGVRTLSLTSDSKFSFRQILRFDKLSQSWLSKNPQTIVFGMERTTCQSHYRAGNGVHASYLEKRRLVDPLWKRCTFGCNPLHLAILNKEKKAFENPYLKKLFTNSYMVRDEILESYQIHPDKIEVVHNGVEWEEWQQDFNETFTDRSQGPFHFLFVGNGYQRKGLSFLLHGLAELKQEEFQLAVVGNDRNLDFFKKKADHLGIKKKIKFFGTQVDLRPFYQKADALVLPTIYDPFANVTIEALAMGLYVLTSHYNGGKEILKNYSGSVIEDLHHVPTVAASLRKVMSYPKTPQSALNIRQSVKDLDFSNQLDRIVLKTLECL
jgi:UDP-glucose:(heptosyl)LPS alpha-1,3-glucosyltransferase